MKRSRAGALTLAASMAAALVAMSLWACTPETPPPGAPINIGTVGVCVDSYTQPTEDGRNAARYPCRWDCRIDGNGLCGPGSHPITLYVDGVCPPVPSNAVCVDVRTATGE